jgi:hypothetical protein
MQSWKHSLLETAKVLGDEEIPEDAGVAIEYQLHKAPNASHDGVEVPVFNSGRTIVDCLRFRDKIGLVTAPTSRRSRHDRQPRRVHSCNA